MRLYSKKAAVEKCSGAEVMCLPVVVHACHFFASLLFSLELCDGNLNFLFLILIFGYILILLSYVCFIFVLCASLAQHCVCPNI